MSSKDWKNIRIIIELTKPLKWFEIVLTLFMTKPRIFRFSYNILRGWTAFQWPSWMIEHKMNMVLELSAMRMFQFDSRLFLYFQVFKSDTPVCARVIKLMWWTKSHIVGCSSTSKAFFELFWLTAKPAMSVSLSCIFLPWSLVPMEHILHRTKFIF